MIESRAAIAIQAGQALSIETVHVEGPREGEVLVEIKATGICHTDAFTLSGDDPERLFPAIHTPKCRTCDYCTSGTTNLCQAIRETQGRGLMYEGKSIRSVVTF
jgi:S-(hydroxymethyl)glutathione dehydrogenase/alcohol dehydrogenase